ncbi:hypothetical protein ABZZ80_08000 [Streptomyces sp. NPDC006356]
MSDDEWGDDRDYRDAVRQAERAKRRGRAVIAGVAGLLAAAVTALVVGWWVIAATLGYAMALMD